MGSGGDRKKFGNAFYDGENNGLEKGHELGRALVAKNKGKTIQFSPASVSINEKLPCTKQSRTLLI